MRDTVVSPVTIHSIIFTIAGIGIVSNILALILLVRTGLCGIRHLIIHIILSDILLLCSAIYVETWTRNEGNFTFNKAACISYLGLEMFGSTALVYFIITLALHSISTARAEKKDYFNRRKRLHDDGETESSRRSLVAGDGTTPPRTMKIDYRIIYTSIPVTIPIVFVWILASSLSIPKIVMAAIIKAGKNNYICTFSDPYHNFYIHTLYAIFNVIIPCLLLTVAIFLICHHLTETRYENRWKESRTAIKMSLSLILAYITLSLPRSLMTTFHTFTPVPKDRVSAYTNPLLHEGSIPPLVGLILCFMHYISSILRPLIYFTMEPEFKRFLKNT